MDVYGIKNYLVRGDALSPQPDDIIALVGYLPTNRPKPAGWRAVDGNRDFSEVCYICMRYELEVD